MVCWKGVSRTKVVVDFFCGLHQIRADCLRGVSVQVVGYKAGRIEVLKHFGTAHNDLSLDHLIDQAEDFLGTNAQLTLDIDRKSTRLNSSHVAISYAVFCLKKNNEAGYYTT